MSKQRSRGALCFFVHPSCKSDVLFSNSPRGRKKECECRSFEPNFFVHSTKTSLLEEVPGTLMSRAPNFLRLFKHLKHGPEECIGFKGSWPSPGTLKGWHTWTEGAPLLPVASHTQHQRIFRLTVLCSGIWELLGWVSIHPHLAAHLGLSSQLQPLYAADLLQAHQDPNTLEPAPGIFPDSYPCAWYVPLTARFRDLSSDK